MAKFTYDKAEWQMQTAIELYCKSGGKKDEDLTDDDYTVLWDKAGLHITMFVTWLIDNNLLSKMHTEDSVEDLAKVKNRQMTGYEYLSNNCDMTLFREDLARKIVRFADEYYEKDYLEQFCKYMVEERHKEILETCFDWADYEGLRKEVLDVAYEQFLENRKLEKEKRQKKSSLEDTIQ